MLVAHILIRGGKGVGWHIISVRTKFVYIVVGDGRGAWVGWDPRLGIASEACIRVEEDLSAALQYQHQ